jgi:cation/acetate symporter
LPSWIFSYGQIALVKICGVNAASAEAVLQACQAAGVTTLNAANFTIAPDTVVIATPEIAGLPYVIAGLVAAGGLAAALSTADGLLLAIANALSHDIYYQMIDHTASTRRRLVVARVLLVVVALIAAYLAITAPAGILIFVSWAFSLAAAGLFPALVLGVWSTRINTQGAIAGMIAGFGVTAYYLVSTEYLGGAKWFNVSNISAGLFGIPVGFIVAWAVSLMTPAPSRELRQFIEELRIPRGEALMADAKRV